MIKRILKCPTGYLTVLDKQKCKRCKSSDILKDVWPFIAFLAGTSTKGRKEGNVLFNDALNTF